MQSSCWAWRLGENKFLRLIHFWRKKFFGRAVTFQETDVLPSAGSSDWCVKGMVICFIFPRALFQSRSRHRTKQHLRPCEGGFRRESRDRFPAGARHLLCSLENNRNQKGKKFPKPANSLRNGESYFKLLDTRVLRESEAHCCIQMLSWWCCCHPVFVVGSFWPRVVQN